jgi:hypothetical protein
MMVVTVAAVAAVAIAGVVGLWICTVQLVYGAFVDASKVCSGGL